MKPFLFSLLLLLSTVRVAYAQGYASSFNGNMGWDWHMTGLWYVDATPSVAGGNQSLNYNNVLGNFDTSAANTGQATSTVINVTHIAQPVLKFSCNHYTETGGAAKDKRWIKILARDGTVLESHQLAQSGGSAATAACAAQGTWHQHAVPIDPAYGFIKIAFVFDSVDHLSNSGAGWFINNVDLRNASAGVLPTQTAYATLFGDAGATVGQASSGWTLGGLWAVDGTPGTMPGGAYYVTDTNAPTHYPNQPWSLNYNDGVDYDTGMANSGEARSPLLDLTFLQQPMLTFKCNYDTETTDTTKDRRFVRILDEGNTLLAEYQLATIGGSPSADACDAMGAWHEHSIPLDPAWRKIYVVFRFDSVDGANNAHAGWFIEDLFLDTADVKASRDWTFFHAYIAIEGGVRKLKFSTATANAGYAPLTAEPASFEFDHTDGHNHLHFKDFVEYRLLDAAGVTVISSRKTGFCLTDITRIRASMVNPELPYFGYCVMIAAGWGDVYESQLAGQEVDLTGVPDGVYRLEYVYDPDAKLVESDETNNIGEGIPIRIQGNNVSVVQASSPSNFDLAPPTVSITSPASGAIVSGSVMVHASATDDTGVTVTHGYVDGLYIGSDVSAPYEFVWNVGAAPAGNHTLKVFAFDHYSEIGEAQIIVKVGCGSTAPTDPKNLVVSYDAATSSTILTWDPNPETTVTGYNVYRTSNLYWPDHSQPPQQWLRLNASPVAATTYTDADPGQPGEFLFFYYVTAVDACGLESLVPPSSGGLYFSEYVEGGGNNKYVEVYNGGNAPVSLDGCKVATYDSGATTPSSTISLTGTLGPGSVYLLCNPSGTLVLPPGVSCNVSTSSLTFNGDDAIALDCNGTRLDVIGQIGVDPGSEWGTGVASTADNTLRRKCSVTAGDLNGSDAFDPAFEWDGFSTNTADDLGLRSCP